VSIVNEMLRLAANSLLTANPGGSSLGAMSAYYSAAYLIHPTVAIRIRNRMHPVALTHTHLQKSFAYEHPLVLPQLMQR
jgi:hypothetical protein